LRASMVAISSARAKIGATHFFVSPIATDFSAIGCDFQLLL